MIDIEYVESLIRILDASSLDSLEIRRGGTRVRLSKSSGFQAAVATGEAEPDTRAAAAATVEEVDRDPPETRPSDVAQPSRTLVDVTSPMVGTFYRAPSPGADPYVAEGGDVREGDVLCVIEAMKLMNELECEVAGRIVEICVDNAEPVDFGQTLFRVDPGE